jgi:hypothetical protein
MYYKTYPGKFIALLDRFYFKNNGGFIMAIVQNTRVISRKCRVIVLRGERHEIYSLSIANLERLKQAINLLLQNFFKQAMGLPKLKWELQKQKGLFGLFKSKKPPTETIAFVGRFLETIFNEPIQLIQAASGLPDKFFDKNDSENCLTIDELIAVSEEIMEVNGLGFLVERLKEWIKMLKPLNSSEKEIQTESSAQFANGTDTQQVS